MVNLRAGTVVGPQHLRSPTVIRRGDAIVIRCISGGLVVKTVGRAGQDGGVGDVITARNERSRDASGLLSVRVTGPGEGVIVAGGASAKPEPKSTVVTGGAKP
ncbi:MAG: flagella basal body P-ring formation protein FlgA [Planctomycetota bacterium]|nr:flagella basal body P-ring formation protein FlgA [Planctomycetota bacterium]